MSERDRFIARLVDADRSLSEVRLPPPGVQRIANELTRVLDGYNPRRRFRWVPMVTFVAGAVFVLAFLSLGDRVGVSASPAPIVSQRAVTRTVVSGDNCRREEGETIEVRGACAVVMDTPGIRVQTIESAHLSIDERILQVHAGDALFDVDKVVGEPVRVLVPGGEIVVVGTRFRVVVRGAVGQVDLYEGRLEFHGDDGSKTPIEAGETLAFGRPHRPAAVPVRAVPEPPRTEPNLELEPAKAPTPSPAQPTKRSRTKPSTPSPATLDAGVLIEEVQRLNQLGQYASAATQLQQALQQRWPKRTAEVLSNELGRILARRLHDPVRACAHWREHLTRFPATRYRTQIAASMDSLGCS